VNARRVWSAASSTELFEVVPGNKLCSQPLPPPRQPRCITGLAEPFHHLVQVRAVSRLDHDFEQGTLGRQVGEGALMRDLDDVGAGFGE